MKHMQLVFAASLVAACVVQVRSGKKWEWICPSSASSCYDECTGLGVRIPPARPGGSQIEVTPTHITFRKKNIYADNEKTGFTPDTKEMVDLFAKDLSGLTPESFLRCLGMQEIPQRNAVFDMLAGLLLGQAEGKLNVCTVVVFLRMFDAEALDASITLRAITNVIKEIRVAENPKNANEYLSTLDILDFYYVQLKDASPAASPISKESWTQIGNLIDQVMKGKRDAAEEIVNMLASHDEVLQGLINLSPADQVNIVQTLSEDVVNFGTFLEYLKLDREVQND